MKHFEVVLKMSFKDDKIKEWEVPTWVAYYFRGFDLGNVEVMICKETPDDAGESRHPDAGQGHQV